MKYIKTFEDFINESSIPSNWGKDVEFEVMKDFKLKDDSGKSHGLYKGDIMAIDINYSKDSYVKLVYWSVGEIAPDEQKPFFTKIKDLQDMINKKNLKLIK